MPTTKKWTDAEKAIWILENGPPRVAWIFERNGDDVYRRPMAEPGTELPPWFSPERKLYSSMLTGRKVDMIILDEALKYGNGN